MAGVLSYIGENIGQLPLAASRGPSRQARVSCEVVTLTVKECWCLAPKMDLTSSLPGLAARVPGNVACQVPAMERGGNIQLHRVQWKPYFPGTKTEIRNEQDSPLTLPNPQIFFFF